MAVAVYLRVSTEEQRERQSIATQREFGERYCHLHNHSVYRVYADDGISGTVPIESRTEGAQILADAKRGKFDQLLIYKLDRLGRETRLILNAVDEFQKLGVRVRSMTEEFDTATSTGRLMLTMLSGFAAHERDVIRERSIAGTQRVAEAGAWMGGIVPYGYRKVGEKRSAHLVVSDDSIPGMAMSEADFIREVFRMSAMDRSSCRVIASRLNELRVPCAYVRDERLQLRGKRKQATSGYWTPGRIRGLITNTTYKGKHEYGKRTKSARPVLPRTVPSIVAEDQWDKAQSTLKANTLFGKCNAKHDYLLRGLIKCALCGRTYVGTASNRSNGTQQSYYRCNGAHTPSIYGDADTRCRSKSIRGEELERQVWADVESFLRNPTPVLERLHAKLKTDVVASDDHMQQVKRFEGLLAQKATERHRVVGLYRRGRLTDPELDAQMDEIAKDTEALEVQVDEIRLKMQGCQSIGSSIDTTQTLLAQLRRRLDEPVCWELKRRLIEILVSRVDVRTFERDGVKQSEITVTYRFSEPTEPLPLTLSQNYNTGQIIRIPIQLNTIGDHIRKKRLGLKIVQKQAAQEIGVCETALFNWEANTSIPEFRYMPAIIHFLGYNPLPRPSAPGEQLVWGRTSLGMSQRALAARLEVDSSTLARWERGDRKPSGNHLTRVQRFLTDEVCSKPIDIRVSV